MQLRKHPLEISLPRRILRVNAFRGIKEPAPTIIEVREVLRSLIEKMVAAGCADADVTQARQTVQP